MGYALARAAARRGADVTLVSGPTALKPPRGVSLISVLSAADMAKAVLEDAKAQDIYIMAAAVADFTPSQVSDHKIKKGTSMPMFEFSATTDILETLGHNRQGHEFICGFAMETEDLIDNAQAKLVKKNADMICANSIREAGSGFGTDTNRITLITHDETIKIDLMSKDEVSDAILDRIISIRKH
jgi:phosphopantothenoylcysteine decarboxylase/phosphopantothenate--cysteine ligase